MVDPIKIIISFVNKIITSIKYIVELLAEGIERVGWKGRNLFVPLVNLWLLSILIPGVRETIKRFRLVTLKQKLVECQAASLTKYGYTWDENNLPTSEMLEPYFRLKNNLDLGVKIFYSGPSKAYGDLEKYDFHLLFKYYKNTRKCQS